MYHFGAKETKEKKNLKKKKSSFNFSIANLEQLSSKRRKTKGKRAFSLHLNHNISRYLSGNKLGFIEPYFFRISRVFVEIGNQIMNKIELIRFTRN